MTKDLNPFFGTNLSSKFNKYSIINRLKATTPLKIQLLSLAGE